MVQRHKICMAVSMDQMHVVSVPPITWHSGGQELYGGQILSCNRMMPLLSLALYIYIYIYIYIR